QAELLVRARRILVEVSRRGTRASTPCRAWSSRISEHFLKAAQPSFALVIVAFSAAAAGVWNVTITRQAAVAATRFCRVVMFGLGRKRPREFTTRARRMGAGAKTAPVRRRDSR